MQSPFRIFITCSIGFEKILLQEVEKSTKGTNLGLGKGGVWAEVGSFSDIIYLNYTLHTANRILVELISLKDPRKSDIYQSLYQYNWPSFFKGTETFSIEVPFSAHPEFNNTLFAAQFMKDAICDRLKKEQGKRPSIDTKKPDIRFQVFLTESGFRFYFDSSNIPLFKRGYRTNIQHVAPLKETLAASLLFAAGFMAEKDILIDPCAGSGTFAIEALLLQHKIAPGLLRKEFGFLLHPLYDFDENRKIEKELQNRAEETFSDSIPIIIEQDKEMYSAILQSIARIGLFDKAHVLHSLFQRYTSSEISKINKGRAPTFFITNPPYGVRMQTYSRNALEGLYRDLGRSAKEWMSEGGKAAFLIPREGELHKMISLRSSARFSVAQGGLDCICALYDIRASS